MGSVVNDQKMMEHLVPEGAEWGDNMRAACILINLEAMALSTAKPLVFTRSGR